MNDFHQDGLKQALENYIPAYELEWFVNTIKQENWNARWESEYDPITVEDKCIIRASFHESTADYDYDILIDPKMSFGTGHHATTFLMISYILKMNLKELDVLDMGTGTGVLAILAEKKGAGTIDAIDIDEWSFLNAKENAGLNKGDKIHVIQGDAEDIPSKTYDVIFANINKNILIHDMHHYVNHLHKNGKIVFSGIYQKDLEDLKTRAADFGLTMKDFRKKNDWVAAIFEK
jgi:ribosomal protein L11 methyltransferase